MRCIPRLPARLMSLLALTLTLLFSAVSGAQSPASEAEIDRRAGDIASNTMSPFCPGKTLTSCPSPYATEWRAEIRAMVAEGKTAAEIKKELEGRAGKDLTGAPEGSYEWALPVAIGLTSLMLLVVAGRRLFGAPDGAAATAQAKKGRGSAAAEEALDARLDQELDQELDQLED